MVVAPHAVSANRMTKQNVAAASRGRRTDDAPIDDNERWPRNETWPGIDPGAMGRRLARRQGRGFKGAVRAGMMCSLSGIARYGGARPFDASLAHIASSRIRRFGSSRLPGVSRGRYAGYAFVCRGVLADGSLMIHSSNWSERRDSNPRPQSPRLMRYQTALRSDRGEAFVQRVTAWFVPVLDRWPWRDRSPPHRWRGSVFYPPSPGRARHEVVRRAAILMRTGDFPIGPKSR